MPFTCSPIAVLAACLVALATFGGRSASAAVFTYDLSGVLDSQVGTYAPGTAFSGSFSYETEGNVDTNALDSVGYYDALSILLMIEGETVTSLNGFIIIENNVNGGDRLLASGIASGTIGGLIDPHVRFNLRANGGLLSTVFTDDSLPDSFLDPSDFTANPRLTVFDGSTGTFIGGGVIDEFAAANPVPEPGTLALLSLGGIGLAAGKFRRRQKAIAA